MYIVACPSDSAFSHHVGQILMIIIVILLVVIILLLLLQYQISLSDQRIPCVFEIAEVQHTKDGMSETSYVVLKNTNTIAYENWNLYAFTYVNDHRIIAELPTLNAYELINSVHHDGVKTLVGSQGRRENHDAYWYSGARLAIDYNDHTIHPGDRVTLEIYNRSTGQLISRDTFPHTDTKTKEMMDEYFNRLNA